MQTAQGRVVELILQDDRRLARLACPQALIPTPGQYLLASGTLSLSKRDASDSPLPVPLFYTESRADGFICALPDDISWNPGQAVFLRGPLGRGFTLPPSARKVALIALDDAPIRLRGLIQSSLKHGAAVVVVCDGEVGNLSDEVEVQPLSALEEVVRWADYVAFDVARENLSQWRARLGMLKQVSAAREAEILIRTPMPCGGVAECGVCAVNVKSGWKMGCKDGPVFGLGEFV